MTISFDELDSPKTFLPGVKAKHAIISTACRHGRGDLLAASAALESISEELLLLLDNWSMEKNATFHLVLTVDSKGRSDPYA